MGRDLSRLSHFLILYKLVEEETNIDPMFHMQIYPGCGENTRFKLLHEKQFGKVKVYEIPWWNIPLLSISVEDGDILFIRTTNNDYVTTGGIWQVKWVSDEDHYTLREISSCGIEMVGVKELLSEDEFILFKDAVTQAKAFLEVQDSLSNLWFVNGREIGTSAPEITHQLTPIPYNVRIIEHTWLIVFVDVYSRIYYLLEVTYHLQEEKWHYIVKLLEEKEE